MRQLELSERTNVSVALVPTILAFDRAKGAGGPGDHIDTANSCRDSSCAAFCPEVVVEVNRHPGIAQLLAPADEAALIFIGIHTVPKHHEVRVIKSVRSSATIRKKRNSSYIPYRQCAKSGHRKRFFGCAHIDRGTTEQSIR